MATRKSLVYLDDVVQRALKDVLIPILGYRDTSKRLGEYTNEIEYLRRDVTDLQIPDKGKIYIHDDMTQPITVYIPDQSYNTDHGSNIENVRISVEFRKYTTVDESRTEDLLACSIMIPGGYVNSSNTGIVPYCDGCNKAAFEILGNAYVKVLTDYSKDPGKVVQLYFPKVNVDTSSDFSRGIVTVYSQHRNVEKVTSWDGVTGNEDTVTLYAEAEVFLGTIPYFTDVENKDYLVRSNTIRKIEGVTAPVYTYLDEADQTDPETLYHERQDDTTTIQGTLTFSDPREIQNRKNILLDIFGTDWSKVDIQFSKDVTDISGAFEGFTFDVCPRSIRGENVTTANNLFKNSSVRHIPDQAELLKGLPELRTFNSGFENTPLKDAIVEDLLLSNNKLESIHYCFKNTMITNTYEFWNMTHTYVPTRESNISSLISNPTSVTVRLEGIACYESVTTLPNDVLNNIPANWKADTKSYSYMTMDEFFAKRESLLGQYDYDLSEVTITIEEDTPDLTGMFEETDIRKAPKSIVAPTATTLDNMFYRCGELVELYSSTVAKLTNVTSAVMFTSSCSKLTTYPEDIFAPLKNITSFQDAMSYLTSMTGPMPTVNGKQLWELQGTTGYPTLISGYNCYAESTFDNVNEAPDLWRGVSA